MYDRACVIALVFATVLAAGCSERVVRVEGENLVVLEGATLVPGDGGPVVPNSSIIIQGERIIRVGRTGEFAYSASSEIHDVQGAWVIPGLIDTHVHLTEQEMMDRVLRLLVAHGITTVRAAAGLGEANVGLREEIETGARIGPRIRTAGMPIDEPDGPFAWMPKVDSPEAMRSEVRRQAEVGVDYIKLYRTIRPELAQVAVDEAHTLGLKVIGHLNLTTWEEASTMGMDGVVHSGIYSPMWELLPEDQWETVRITFNDAGRNGVVGGFDLLSDGIDVESQEFRRWAATLRDNGLPVEPNLVMQKAAFWGNDESVYRSFEPENAPDSWQGTSRLAFPRQNSQATNEWRNAGRTIYPLLEEMVVALYRSGVLLSAGTDMMLPWMTPGTSLHRELHLLGEAGLTPEEVLQVATWNGARAMDLSSDIGAVSAGKMADLVVLNSDPLMSVENIRDIRLVVLRGHVQTPAEWLG